MISLVVELRKCPGSLAIWKLWWFDHVHTSRSIQRWGTQTSHRYVTMWKESFALLVAAFPEVKKDKNTLHFEIVSVLENAAAYILHEIFSLIAHHKLCLFFGVDITFTIPYILILRTHSWFIFDINSFFTCFDLSLWIFFCKLVSSQHWETRRAFALWFYDGCTQLYIIYVTYMWVQLVFFIWMSFKKLNIHKTKPYWVNSLILYKAKNLICSKS